MLFILLLIMGMVGGWLAWTHDPGAEALTYESATVLVGAEPAPERVAYPVQVEVTLTEAQQVVSPDWDGTVTAVRSDVSTWSPKAGDYVLTLDGIKRYLYVAPCPLFRVISIHDSGKDVRCLAQFLRSTGHLANKKKKSTFDRELMLATRSFAKSAGVPGSQRIEYFDPAWLLQMLSTSDSPVSYLVSLGDRVRGGDAILAFERQVTSVSFTTEASTTLRSSLVEVSITGSSLSLPVVNGNLAEDSEGLAALASDTAELDATTVTLEATGEFELPQDAAYIPTTSVIATGSGEGCVLVATGTEESPYEPKKIVAIANDVATSRTVVLNLNKEDTVVVGPVDPALRALCEALV